MAEFFGLFWICFGNFLNFFLNFLGICLEEFFGRNFLGGFLGGFFGRIFLGGMIWEEFFVSIGIDLFVKILVFVKILSKVTRKEGRILDP